MDGDGAPPRWNGPDADGPERRSSGDLSLYGMVGRFTVPRRPVIRVAECWDTHDVTEFEDELEEVEERVFERDTEITVQLETNDANAVRAMAKSRGVGDSELIREGVLQRLHAT